MLSINNHYASCSGHFLSVDFLWIFAQNDSRYLLFTFFKNVFFLKRENDAECLQDVARKLLGLGHKREQIKMEKSGVRRERNGESLTRAL